ncbi:MAG: N-acetyltransferase [Bacteroidetes bacterium]|nr:MAG: N-acetyltransferase [Bacteroidota bacterium]
MEIRSPETNFEWEAYYDLRYRVLREPLGKERGSEKNEGDEKGIHLAIFEDLKVKAIARLDYDSEEHAQVRFVAVETDEQGRGWGRKIMDAVEERCKQDQQQLLILHARDYAVEFYLKLGYEKVAKSHKLFGVLQHYLMQKKLT